VSVKLLLGLLALGMAKRLAHTVEEFKDFIPPPGHFLWDHLLSFKRLPRFPFIHLL